MNAAIVVPIYKPRGADLKWFERISLQRCLEVFGGKYPIVFIAPNDREFDYLPRGDQFYIARFDAKYFAGVGGYNQLMLSPHFYEKFREFDYILIHQLDAFVFSDRLQEFCELGYDYIGAPWSIAAGLKSTPFLYVGNGGFSLRRVRACFYVLSKNFDLINSLSYPEDAMFSYLGKIRSDEFKVAPIRTASQFAVEHLPERWCRKNGNVLPFGCHGWYALSSAFYVKVFSEFGYDLLPYEHVMGNIDLINRDGYLQQASIRRLINRINHGHSLLKYLPSNEKFFVMIADEQSKILAQRLYSEGLRIVNTNSIPILVNEDQISFAIVELIRSKMRGLLLSLTDDSRLLEYVARHTHTQGAFRVRSTSCRFGKST